MRTSHFKHHRMIWSTSYRVVFNWSQNLMSQMFKRCWLAVRRVTLKSLQQHNHPILSSELTESVPLWKSQWLFFSKNLIVADHTLQHIRCLHSHHCRLFGRIDKHFVGDWMVLFCCMVNLILSTNLHKFPAQKCGWPEFWLFIAEYCRLCDVRYFQYRIVCHTRNSGRVIFRFAIGVCDWESMLYWGTVCAA